MNNLYSIIFVAAALIGAIGTANADNEVYVNGELIKQNILISLSKQYKIDIQDGRYWYDKNTGGWGLEGGPTAGYIMPHQQLGGKLKPNASGGNTGVFVNGRELHQNDVAQLQRFMTVIPGRYWVDSRGIGGYENGPALFNLVQLAQRSSSTFYRNNYTGIGTGSSGGTSYVIGKDFSVIVD